MRNVQMWAAVVVIGVCLLGTAVRAHEVTSKGTVISAEPQAIKMMVVNEKTKKPEPKTFDLDKETKIFRGTTAVTFEAARIQKGETVAVTVDHDTDETLALVVRLEAKKDPTHAPTASRH